MEDRGMIERHLAQAEMHVIQGETRLGRQREVVAELERDGQHEAAQTARELLATFETAQQSNLDDRDRLRAELAALK